MIKINNYLQKLLISPITGYPLRLIKNTSRSDKRQLIGKDLSDIFGIVEGIPILLPHDQIADYIFIILDILYKDHTKEFYDNIMFEEDNERLMEHIINDFGKSGILRKFEEYSKMDKEKRLFWYGKFDKNQIDNNTQVPAMAYKDGLANAKELTGKKRLEMTDEMISQWAVHLNDYANLVTKSKRGIILELGTGAGLGTCGLINEGLGDGKLISIDIDFAAVANAKGIAKYLKIENKIDPIVANFWRLPFRRSSIDVVCSHYGLDESREIPCILSEISRVLKDGGEFINVSRKDPTIRIKQILGKMGFNDEEYKNLIHWTGFYGGMKELKYEAQKYNLVLDYQKSYAPINSHERIISVFKKYR